MEKHINRATIMKRENSTNLWTEWAVANSGLAKGGVSFFVGTFVQGSNICASYEILC
jgi:hypothetical protein